MYTVLLVDDEPLVLTGIKMMIDWQAIGCQLVDSARNGKQALEIMDTFSPDIVIADINMPVMNGIELLKQAQEKHPNAVFVMLTNMQEFELARDSLQYRAVDYLLKTEIDQQILTSSLEKAKLESTKRRAQSKHTLQETVRINSDKQLLCQSISHLFASAAVPPEIAETLHKNGVLDSYMMLEIYFTYPASSERDSTMEEKSKLFLWQCEVLEEAAVNCFSQQCLVKLEYHTQSVFFLVWGSEPEKLKQQVENFYKKSCLASSNITRIELCLAATDAFKGKYSLANCRKQVFSLQDYFYNTGTKLLCYRDIPPIEYQDLVLSGIGGKLKIEVRSKNVTGCNTLFDRAIVQVEKNMHEKSQGIWLCTEMYFSAMEALRDSGIKIPFESAFSPSETMQDPTRVLMQRKDVVQFLEGLKTELEALLHPSVSNSLMIIEQAQKYIADNIDRKIMLQDVARHVNISPSYLSALFKKQCGENLVDYINRTKMVRACELIRHQKYRISQIGYMLGFENAYYFTRVFKRYIGGTPSEYNERIKNEEASHE